MCVIRKLLIYCGVKGHPPVNCHTVGTPGSVDCRCGQSILEFDEPVCDALYAAICPSCILMMSVSPEFGLVDDMTMETTPEDLALSPVLEAQHVDTLNGSCFSDEEFQQMWDHLAVEGYFALPPPAHNLLDFSQVDIQVEDHLDFSQVHDPILAEALASQPLSADMDFQMPDGEMQVFNTDTEEKVGSSNAPVDSNIL
ncbi:hypothetical protein B0T16DRAFT_454991 [Cercophora newfieldiana]|uniref:Uncharacterized protein n=1 Tax=Cercophora newfieldiana TaxID=92897 RepID=A0AA40CVX9_9PEZI|nr:hypothetical protein B0T16DRAFT_454991 [Cercophora newfieldiana]